MLVFDRQRSASRLGWPAALCLAVLLLPAPAEAHTALRDMGSFWAGVAHLLTSLDQVAFLVGLAIWTSFHERRLDARIIMAAFLAMNVGTFAGGALTGGSSLDLAGPLALLLTLVGAAGAARLRTGDAGLIGVALVGGLIGGIEGADATAGLSLGLFSLGGALGAAAALSYGLLGMRFVQVEWGRIALRAGSSWIAAIGLMILALAISRNLGRV